MSKEMTKLEAEIFNSNKRLFDGSVSIFEFHMGVATAAAKRMNAPNEVLYQLEQKYGISRKEGFIEPKT